eukprot:TRINITY_DN79295_c0_g1_i1.p1 TRINITY_DN79295_c0_g1~~TRINITY_DN79295_c0_g1_i1.p1  ORF type:complete len:409 (+),score=59.23 TRINITY_DN79295_c0_g1_i1:35-1228(+)
MAPSTRDLSLTNVFGEVKEKVNYRSIGRGTGGVIKQKRPAFKSSDLDRPRASTIPTKFETILFHENREKKGFGGQATRFATPRRQNPGPGAYETPAAEQLGDAQEETLAIANQGEGRNQNGHAIRAKGPFASKTPRLPHSSKQHGGFVNPGPGQYEGDVEDRRPQLPTAAFSLSGPGNPLKFGGERQLPGPGHYFGPDGNDLPIGTRATPAHGFGNGQRQGLVAALQDMPGPGSYEVSAEPLETTMSDTKRRMLLPPDRIRAVTEASMHRTGQEFLEKYSSSPVSQDPGPGSYVPNLDSIKGKTEFNAKGQSSFHLGNSHLARSYQPAAPGPGQYTIEKEPDCPASAAGTGGFASHTSRFRDSDHQAPGPAYYSPRKKAGNESFNLNALKGWLPVGG